MAVNATNVSTGAQWLLQQGTDVFLFDTNWIFGAVLTIIVLAILSRSMHNWQWMAFPLSVLLTLGGFYIHALQWFITAIMFAITILSTPMIGDLISVRQKERKEEKRRLTRAIQAPHLKIAKRELQKAIETGAPVQEHLKQGFKNIFKMK